MAMADREVLEGYVADLACLRKVSREGLAGYARRHTKACNLMGHCMESGYGLVDDDGELALLDAAATPQVVEALRGSARDAGIRLRVVRARSDDGQQTLEVREVATPGS
jgi:hypothetical protein